MLRKKQIVGIVSVVILFLVGTIFNVNFMALSSDETDEYGVPFRRIWSSISDLYLEIDNSNTALIDLSSALDTYMEKTDDAFVAIEAAIGTIEEITNHTKTIKYVKTEERLAPDGVWVDAAIFWWTPNNSTNNAILNVYYYAEYKTVWEPTDNTTWIGPSWRIVVNGISNWQHVESISDPMTRPYTWAPLYSWVFKSMKILEEEQLHGGIIPNQPSYTIKFQIRNKAPAGTVFFRNFNIIIEVTDGL